MKGTNIYYTVELETDKNSDEDKLTGIKTVSIYKIVRNNPVLLDSISCKLSDYSRNIVVVYLHQNYINFNEITQL